MNDRPPMIRTNPSNAFAHNTMKVRVPATIQQVQQLNPDYPPSIQRALTRLAQEIAGDAPIPMLEPFAPDYDLWAEHYAVYAGDTWLNTDWFFAETFFYRLLMQAVRWWEIGRDPFAPRKAEELASAELWDLLERVLAVRDTPPDERLMALVHFALWGNRIDLSFAASLAHGGTGHREDLLCDDSQAVVEHLLRKPGPVHIISDNAGTELATDLALADALLDHAGADAQVIFHLKMHPTFVSDAVPGDVLILVEAMASGAHGVRAAQLGQRLRAAVDDGRLRLIPAFYWNSSRLLWQMPAQLSAALQSAALVIVKGDANYRRMVGDAIWPPETPFAHVTRYFPAPLLALRTMKSDPVVGLPAGLAADLDSVDAQWRVNGRRGLIQFRV